MQLKLFIRLFLGYILFLNSLTSFANNSTRFSLEAKDIAVVELLKMISQHSDKNIIVSDNVSGKVTLSLSSVSWREALDAILNMEALVKHETENVIVVLPVADLKKFERTILQQRYFKLHHVMADEVVKLLKSSGVLSDHGKAEANRETNSLVISDSSDNIRIVEGLIKELDVLTKQVLIEARIVNADEAFMRELGVEYLSKQNSSGVGASGVKVQSGSYQFAIAKFSDNNLLDLKLSALENDGRGKVISKPKLLTADRKSAYIEAGAEIPYQEKTKEGNTSVVFKKAVLSLTVTPEVVSQEAVKLNLQLNQDKMGHLLVNGVPTIDTRRIQTQALVRNGETMVLGGIYEWSKNIYETGVPLLKNIPLVKIFFSKKETKVERRELLIFVTPHII